MRNTIRNVTIVVPVLMTSCHVSVKPNIGPVAAHETTTPIATTNASGFPDARAVHFVRRVNQLRLFVGCIPPPLVGGSYPISPYQASALSHGLQATSYRLQATSF